MAARALTDAVPPQLKLRRPQVEGQEHAWQPWTKEEEERLLAAFDGGATVKELASAHKRKVGGITARLVKLGRLQHSAPREDDA